MPTRWIDFRALKEKVSIRDVLARYGFLEKLREKGPGKLVGSCPIHAGSNGNAFHVNMEKNVFNCFAGCGGGNVLDFVSKMEKCGIREAGEKLASWFGLEFRPSDTSGNPARFGHPAKNTAVEEINPPLTSPLKTLDPKHPYLLDRGLTPDTIRTFGLGFCARGLMKGRIAIPIHNERAELVAYAGRALDAQLAKEEGKYKLPAGFQKGQVVYNLHRAKDDAGKGVYIVEGFFDALKVHQAGFPNVVALMGSSMTQEQEELLVATTDRWALMFDGDEAGVAGLRKVYGRVRRRVYLREIHLEAGEQPDSLSERRLKGLLA